MKSSEQPEAQPPLSKPKRNSSQVVGICEDPHALVQEASLIEMPPEEEPDPSPQLESATTMEAPVKPTVGMRLMNKLP